MNTCEELMMTTIDGKKRQHSDLFANFMHYYLFIVRFLSHSLCLSLDKVIQDVRHDKSLHNIIRCFQCFNLFIGVKCLLFSRQTRLTYVIHWKDYSILLYKQNKKNTNTHLHTSTHTNFCCVR